MSYAVEVKKSAVKSYERLPHDVRKTVAGGLKQLARFPKVPNVRKLHRPLMGYQLRVGKYRVLFTVDSLVKLITVYTIDHRKDAYK